ncbi:MAG: hypothetical protein J7K61_00060 [Thermoplasmata archaeon]|nr:hypothetical protein [Thermoplasmata archaeon]
MNVTDEIKGELMKFYENDEENKSNNGSTPGFEMTLLLLSMATVAIGIRKRRK